MSRVRYHIYKDFGGDILEKCCIVTVMMKENNVVGLLRSGTAAKHNQNIYSLEVLVRRRRLIKSDQLNHKTWDCDTCSND